MKFNVLAHTILREEDSPTNQGELNVTSCQFEFAKSYDGLTKKAVFTRLEDGKSYETPIIDSVCQIPAEVLTKKGSVKLGVYAYEAEEGSEKMLLRYSPTPVVFDVLLGSYMDKVENPSDVSASQAEIYEQRIQAEIDDLIQKRDSGYFNGPKGEKGDKGDTGETGPQGEKGEQGETGATGPQGEQGPQGEKGDKGDKGDTGEQGPQGEKGETGAGANTISNEDWNTLWQ